MCCEKFVPAPQQVCSLRGHQLGGRVGGKDTTALPAVSEGPMGFERLMENCFVVYFEKTSLQSSDILAIFGVCPY